jgi:ATP/maltotriose-dependent transcriptional regulator MalT
VGGTADPLDAAVGLVDYLGQARVAAAMTLARAGDLQQARVHLEAAERIAGMWQGGPWLAAVWEARGVLRWAEGDRAQAAALFKKEAAEQFARARRAMDQARCRAAAAASTQLEVGERITDEPVAGMPAPA